MNEQLFVTPILDTKAFLNLFWFREIVLGWSVAL